MNILQFILKQISDIRNNGFIGFWNKIKVLLIFIKNIPGYLIALLAVLITRILSSIILIRVGKISENFGNTVSDLEIYLIKKKNNLNLPKKKTIDFFYLGSKKKNFNTQIILMLKRNLSFLPNYFLNPIFVINVFLNENSKYIINDNHYSLPQEYKSKFERYYSLSFTSDEKKRGTLALQKFGLKEDDKFICLSVRDEKFKKEIMISNNFNPSTDFKRNDYRNWKIDSFSLAADSLAKKGYYVFRMGKNVKGKFKTTSEKVIDYANSKYRSDFLDIFLGANCEFCISTGLGFDEVPEIFRKPTLLMGILPIGIYRNYNKRFMVCFKHHYSKKNNKNLSLSEIFEERLAFSFSTKDFEKKKIDLIELSPEDIRDISLEMVEYLKKEKTIDTNDIDNQKKFNEIYQKNWFKYSNLEKQDKRLSEKQKITLNMSPVMDSKTSAIFLKKYPEWLR